jgi:hypothetical protein
VSKHEDEANLRKEILAMQKREIITDEEFTQLA